MTAANIQKALEAADVYGAGNVEVSGGQESSPGSGVIAPLRVNSVNGDADRAVQALEVHEVIGHVAYENVVTKGEPPAREILVSATNLGDGEVDGETGSPVTILDKLPAGFTAISPSGRAGPFHDTEAPEYGPVECEILAAGSEVKCTYAGKLPPYERIWVDIPVEIAANATEGSENEARISGGGAAPARTSRPVSLSSAQTPFGVENYELRPENADGSIDTQAGSHPFQLTSTIALNETGAFPYQPVQPKNLQFDLPPGLIGNPVPFPQCTLGDFNANSKFPHAQFTNKCPADTQIGVAMITVQVVGEALGGKTCGLATVTVPLFNLEPAPGEPARFGFSVCLNPVYLDTAVRTGSDYGITVNVTNTTQIASFLAARVSIWGTPGDPRHDNSRGWTCGYSLSKLGEIQLAKYRVKRRRRSRTRSRSCRCRRRARRRLRRR